MQEGGVYGHGGAKFGMSCNLFVLLFVCVCHNVLCVIMHVIMHVFS